jgi:hypothetical protein
MPINRVIVNASPLICPYPYPLQNESGQVVENLPASNYLVPKRGLEPLQAIAY